MTAAVAEGSSQPPGALKPVAEHGAPSVGSLSPDSRQGRVASSPQRRRFFGQKDK